MKWPARINTFLEKIDDKQRYYIFAGLLLLIFLLDYFILMRPQLGALSKITPEIKILQDDLVLAKENIARKTEYQTQVEKLKSDVEQANARVKPRSQLPLVFEWISRAADASGVTIDQMMPLIADQQSLLKARGREYVSIPLKIQARGGYHQFGRFLNRLESGDIFFAVDNFSILSSESQNPHTIQLMLQAVIYE